MRTEHRVCNACGYIKIRESKTVDEVARYKSGKRKGEIKEVGKTKIEFSEGDLDFHKLPVYIPMPPDMGGMRTFDLLICPMCGTVKFPLEKIYELDENPF